MSRPRTRRRSNRRALSGGAAASVLAHGLVVLVIVSQRVPVMAEPPAPTVTAELVRLAPPPPPPRPPVPPTPKPEPKPQAAPPSPVKAVVAKAPPARKAHVVADARAAPTAVGKAEGSGTSDELSAGEIAGAASADSRPEGGECDMPRRLQRALRKDGLVQSAAAHAAGKALMVWNGDWVQGHGEDGKGLAAVREAILWEVGFAPRACRQVAVRGLILISLGEGPRAPRLALGRGEWRWGDVLR